MDETFAKLLDEARRYGGTGLDEVFPKIAAEYDRVCAERDEMQLSRLRHVEICAQAETELAAERQRAERYREALENLVQYLDDHDWGHVPEPVDVTVAARAALAGEQKS